MSTTTQIMGFQSPFGDRSLFSDPPQNQPYLLQIILITKPVDFGGSVSFEIITNLPEGEAINISIYDVDSIFSNSPDKDTDTLLLKKSYTLGKKNVISIPFNTAMQEAAFKDIEFGASECYIRITNAKISDVVSEVFKVNKGSKSASLGAFDILEAGKKKNQRPTVLCNPMNLTAKQKAILTAVVYGESKGDEGLFDLVWVYFNLIQDIGFDKAMNRSSHYTGHASDSYRTYEISMYYLGFGDEYKDNIEGASGLTVEKFIEAKNGIFLKAVKPRLENLKTYLAKNIFINKPMNPYVGFQNQGYWGDMKIREPKLIKDKKTGEMVLNSRRVWAEATQYFILQNQKTVTKILVVELPGYDMWGHNITTFIYNFEEIEQFFTDNSTLIPYDYEKVPLLPDYKNKK